MVYENKFVMCVIINGEPVKELANGEVHIPFNQPYVLRFRNKNNFRALVKFWIDEELCSGNGFIIPANSYIDIKRYEHKDASFILVPLDSSEAVDAGKNGQNHNKTKGLIRAEFYEEKRFQPIRQRRVKWQEPHKIKPYYDQYLKPDIFCNVQEGCTIEGSSTGQTFSNGHIEVQKTPITLKIFLKGYHLEVQSKIASDVCDDELQKILKENKELKFEIEKAKRIQSLKEENEKLKKKLAEYRSS